MYRISPLFVFEDENVGLWIVNIRHNIVEDEELRQGLINLKIDFSKKMTAEDQIKIIKKAIDSKAKGISVVNGKYVISRHCIFEEHKIGTWIYNINSGKTKNLKLKKELLEIGVDLPEDIVSSSSDIF